MATIHMDQGYAETAVTRRPLLPAIRWGAVIAGVAVGISVQLVLTLLGIATGLSATDVGTTEGATLGRGAMIWAGASMLIAAFVGGYVAARMTGLKRKADGVLHGVVSWAVTTLMFATLATSATGSMLGSVFGSMNPGRIVSSAVSGDAGAAASRLADTIRTQTGVNVTPENMRTLQQMIASRQRDQAVQYMVSSMGVEQSKASTIVDQALIVTGAPAQASPQGQEQANQALQSAGMAAWTVFGAVALSLALGIIGGLLGSIGARRTTWTESGPTLASASAARPMADTTTTTTTRDTITREPLGRDPLGRDPMGRDPT